MGSLRRVVGPIALALLAVVVGLAALLAVAAFGFDVLSHFAPVYLAVGLGGGLTAVALRRLQTSRFILACGLIATLGAGALMAPEFRREPAQQAPASTAGQIKLIQLNAYKRNADIRRVADWLIAQDPDIVTLQEARHDLRDELMRRTDWQVAGAKEHVMIFSRARRIRMVRPPLKHGGLTYLNATYAGPTGPYEVITTHFDWPTSPTYRRQHEDLAGLTAALPRDRMIVTGDLNTTPWSRALRRTDAALGLHRVDRAIFSWPARVHGKAWPVPVLPIDHVYVGRGWRIVSIERGPSLGSDHYPLVVILTPN
ncbi:endonuclease/exonuclease/phosphatase family protein [Phenylobacterium kunshanense]|uniref:endonuclease/exonuclease/phosphatase family protein n=1 Tax=Phenylobacterium kunshanense TaxID=1445034 RepID=UPI0014025855|nr:endonuclease/exonuclease/phosphatase family protein [Phenylobacterium kunshanense]